MSQPTKPANSIAVPIIQLAHPIYRLIDIAPDLAVLPLMVAAVKDAGDGKSVLFLHGTGAMDGFVIEREWMDVVGELNDELERAAEEAARFDDGSEEADSDEED